MSQPPLDEQGEAHEALHTAVDSYGPRVLRNPQILGNLVTDLLPDLPRERSLLVAAAEADVASELSQHVDEQHVDADTAVQLVARALSERKSIDAAASLWVTTEYARALGYPARPYAQPGMPAFDAAGRIEDHPVAAEPPVTAPAAGRADQAPTQAPPLVVPPFQQPPAQQPFQQQAPPPQPPPPWQQPPAQQQPYQHMETEVAGYGGGPGTGGTWPDHGGGAGTGGSGGGNRRRLVAIIAVVGVLVVYLIVAAVAQVFPFAKSNSAPRGGVIKTTPPPHSPTPSPTPSATLPSNIASLTQLLPGDLDQKATECPPQPPPYKWAMPGLVQAVTCTDPGLPGGQVYAYQMDSAADFQTAWKNFNTWWGFDITSAGTNCPPAGSNGQGTIGWHNNYFPQADGQSLECEFVGTNNNEPAYAWAFPSDYAFIVAQGNAGSSFAALDKWWTNGATQTASPTPAVP